METKDEEDCSALPRKLIIRLLPGCDYRKDVHRKSDTSKKHFNDRQTFPDFHHQTMMEIKSHHTLNLLTIAVTT